MKTQSDIPLSEDRPKVRIYAVKNMNKGYEEMGNGVLQLVTDAYQNHSEHYIEVKDFKTQDVLLRSHLLKQNNFQVQKDSVICWTDASQPVYEDIGISFETQEECDIYWYTQYNFRRLICSKIGKNYLQINGSQTLQMPSEHNMNYIMQKVKSSFKMIAYNIINSNQFLDSLEFIFDKMKNDKDQMGIGMVARIMKAILNSYDIKVLDCLLGDRHFNFFLRVQQCTLVFNSDQLGIQLRQIYHNKTKMRMLIILPQEISEKINIVHRALFCKEYILDLSKEIRLQNMLKIIINDKYTDIITYLIHGNILRQISELTLDKFVKHILETQPQLLEQYEKKFNRQNQEVRSEDRFRDDTSQKIDLIIPESQQPENERQDNMSKCTTQKVQQESLQNLWKLRRLHSLQLNKKITGHEEEILKTWKIDFVIQSFGIVKQLHGERTKKNYFNRIYECKILKTFELFLDDNYFKSLEVFIEVASFDPTKFIDYIRDEFRESPSVNLHRKLAKKFCSGGKQFETRILELLEVLLPTLKERKDFLDFYSGTFLVFIFEHFQKVNPLLNLIYLFLTSIPENSSFHGLISRHKVFQSISNHLSKKITKQEYMGSVKIIRHLVTTPPNLTQIQYSELAKAREHLINSELLDQCLQFYRRIHRLNNIPSSSMLQLLKMITTSQFTIITEYLKNKYSHWGNISLLFQQISQMNPPSTPQTRPIDMNQVGVHHLSILQHEQEQKYLNQEQKPGSSTFYQHGEKQQNGSAQDQYDVVKRQQQLQEMMDQIRKKAKGEEEEETSITSQQNKNSHEVNSTVNTVPDGLVITFDPPDPSA